ncbi:MAG TPA: family 43 glycosylhydrolase [Tepidisphaeraceae bacterium]|jgi:beta-xylosidase
MRFRFLFGLLSIAPLCSHAAVDQLSGSLATIHNDFYWLDQDGNRILTRSGCLCRFGDTFYWYGGNPRGFREQHCYTSADLMHWTHRGVVLRHDVDANRIDVLYNAKTKQYVMFLKYDGNGAHFATATADKPEGPFTFREQMLIDGARMGDMSMFQDDDGAAYLCYVSWAVGTNAQHGIYRLSDDYLKPQQRVFLWDIRSREAPHMFKHDGLYYYGTSRTAWIDSTGTNYYTARQLAGPWSPAKPMSTPGSQNSWDTQCDFVFPIRGTQDTIYMYAGDRWLKDAAAGRNGDYVWLPIAFEGETPIVNYHQDWEIDLAAGTWRPFDSSRNLAAGKPASASSEQAPNLASQVTAPKTYVDYASKRWESDAADPQWITVDLQQPTEFNRVILKWAPVAAREFQIQTSDDGQSFRDVFTSDKGVSLSVTDVKLPLTKARFVRIYGKQRAPLPPPPGRRIVSSTRSATQGVPVPSSQPATAPARPAGYSLFDVMVLKD